MTILALTDIHAAYDLANAIIEKEPADVLVIGGDLTNVGSVREAEIAVNRFREPGRTLLAVAGNMDLPQHDELFERLNVSMNGRGVIIDEVGFFGVSGAPHSPLRTPYELSEEEIHERIVRGYESVKSAAKKVFVPHAPPFGTRVDIIRSGIHVGSHAVREFIEEFEPDVVICGHIHEARRRDAIGKSVVVNCGPARDGCYAIINILDVVTVETRRFKPAS